MIVRGLRCLGGEPSETTVSPAMIVVCMATAKSAPERSSLFRLFASRREQLARARGAWRAINRR